MFCIMYINLPHGKDAVLLSVPCRPFTLQTGKAQCSQSLLKYKFSSLNNLGDSPYNCIQFMNFSLTTQHSFCHDRRSGSILPSSTLKAAWSRARALVDHFLGFLQCPRALVGQLPCLALREACLIFFLFSSSGNLYEQRQQWPTEVPSLSSSSWHLQTQGSCSSSTSTSSWTSTWLPSWATASLSQPQPATTACTLPCTSSLSSTWAASLMLLSKS